MLWRGKAKMPTFTHFKSWWMMSICSFIKCKYLFLILFWAFCPQLLSYRLCDWHFNSLRIAYLRTLSIDPNSIDTNPVPLGHSCRCSTPCYLMTIVLAISAARGRRPSDLSNGGRQPSALLLKEHVTARAAAKPVNSLIEEQMWTSQPLFVGNFSFANFLPIFANFLKLHFSLWRNV